MTQDRLATIDDFRTLYRDDATGIAWVADTSVGLGYACHANISASGSVKGMKTLGYWQRHDRTRRSHGFIYNIDTFVVSAPLDVIAAAACICARCDRPERDFQAVIAAYNPQEIEPRRLWDRYMAQAMAGAQ